jgi:hypothetical protein
LLWSSWSSNAGPTVSTTSTTSTTIATTIAKLIFQKEKLMSQKEIPIIIDRVS